MQYYLIEFDAGVSLLQEIHNGAIVRYCDLDGATQSPPMGGARFVREVVPEFTIPPAPAPQQAAVVVPQSITRLQAKLALSGAGLLATIEAMMAGLEAENVQRLAWENALQFERDSEMVNGMASVLGISQDQLDALFIAASAIEV